MISDIAILSFARAACAQQAAAQVSNCRRETGAILSRHYTKEPELAGLSCRSG